MPIYEYRCDQGHTFEVLQRMSEDPLASCTTCGAPVRRVLHPVAVHFKGSGFYNTDYGKRKRGGDGADGEGKAETSSASKEGSSGEGSSSGGGSSSDSSASGGGSKSAPASSSTSAD